ncbi:glycosyltransferase [Stenotrophomonas sp.]|uniref:glycosyltransferase n=1 Tax=Stenotrophomonas sp. TaxID=69392 RepID=UPI0028ACA195|nr:glycosyltransferase [Stenotrophomonas sp.]
MKILFIGKRFYTNRDAALERYGRIYQLPCHWAIAGVQTSLWLLDYHSRTPINQTDDNPPVHSTPVLGLSSIAKFLKILLARRKHNFDVVVASGDCYIALMAFTLARSIGARFVFDVYDKYDEFGGYWSPPRFDLFNYLLDRADGRIFASRALKEQLRRSTNDHLAANGIDISKFVASDIHAARRALGLPIDKILVGYFGSITSDRGVEDLILAQNILRSSNSPIHLVLAGKKEFEIETTSESITYLGNIPADRVPLAMSACDLLALPYRTSPYLDMASSCKITEYIAIGKPIVATLTPNLASNFPEQTTQLGEAIAIPGDPESIARTIVRQLEFPTLVDMPAKANWESIAADTLNYLGSLDSTAQR